MIHAYLTTEAVKHSMQHVGQVCQSYFNFMKQLQQRLSGSLFTAQFCPYLPLTPPPPPPPPPSLHVPKCHLHTQPLTCKQYLTILVFHHADHNEPGLHGWGCHPATALPLPDCLTLAAQQPCITVWSQSSCLADARLQSVASAVIIPAASK